ncbi:MAG: T9SS type A sorting domain-containing protein [Bacteroidales bacterium]|nr:T9SS type A sorting domain-containing protein [Bacteroidales bacterium]
MEYGLYLTFSADNYFSSYDTLEVVLNFDLPDKAIITDSWLWIGDDISKALIMDQWTATLIYESIVKRRRDPSILYKKSSTQYELRIFPMAGNETRKVKITYLVPAAWNNDYVLSPLPVQLINTSSQPLEKFKIITWSSGEWQNPIISGGTDISFSPETNAEYGAHFEAEIPSSQYSNSFNIGFSSPLENGFYLNKYAINENEGIYQLAVLPSAYLDSLEHRKVMVILDYDISNSYITKSDVINQTKSILMSELSEKDSFNLFLSNIQTYKSSENWVNANSENVTQAFENITSKLSNYSNLASVTTDAIDFINKHGKNAEIILISNSDQYGSNQTANEIINDLLKLMETKIPIHIAYFQEVNYKYYWFGGRSYYGNEYLFYNLSKISGGSYQKKDYNNSLNTIITSCFNYLHGTVKSFDLYTSLDDGICYSRYFINNNPDIVYVNQPILQVGKYKGNFPFNFELSGEYLNELFSHDESVDNLNVYSADSVSQDIWTGLYIQKLEQTASSNELISDIIRYSIDERILSLYTAFICLEDTTTVCEDCEEEDDENGWPTLINENNTKPILNAYPNPFSHEITISIKLNAPENEDVTFEIYNVTGELVYVFSDEYLTNGSEISLTWDGKTTEGVELPAGIYLFTIKTGKGTYHLKLVKQN